MGVSVGVEVAVFVGVAVGVSVDVLVGVLLTVAVGVVVGVPVAVTDDVEASRATAGETFEVYGRLTNYRRVLDRGEVDGPADIAIVGTEQEVAAQIASYEAAGATALIAVIFPTGDDPEASVERTTELLEGLVARR